MSTTISVRVDLHDLPAKLEALKAREIKRANKTIVSKAGTVARSYARAKAPRKTGIGRDGIRKKTTSMGAVAISRVFLSGPHAHIMRWQDQGTGPRDTKRSNAYRGRVEPQYFMERAATAAEDALPYIAEAEVEAAIIRSGLA